MSSRKTNLLGQPIIQLPLGYTITEYDVSSGILKPATIPQQIYQKLPIQRQPFPKTPTLDLSILDRQQKRNLQKLQLETYYNKQPELMKLPKSSNTMKDVMDGIKSIYDASTPLINRLDTGKILSDIKSKIKNDGVDDNFDDIYDLKQEEFEPASDEDESKHDTKTEEEIKEERKQRHFDRLKEVGKEVLLEMEQDTVIKDIPKNFPIPELLTFPRRNEQSILEYINQNNKSPFANIAIPRSSEESGSSSDNAERVATRNLRDGNITSDSENNQGQSILEYINQNNKSPFPNIAIPRSSQESGSSSDSTQRFIDNYNNRFATRDLPNDNLTSDFDDNYPYVDSSIRRQRQPRQFIDLGDYSSGDPQGLSGLDDIIDEADQL